MPGPETTGTQFPDQDLHDPALHLDPALIGSIELQLYESLRVALSDRNGLDDALDYWNDLAEQIVEESNDPWPDAASLCMPVVASAINDVRARLMAALFVKTPYVIHGLTAEAAALQEKISRYYNALFYSREFLRAHDDTINLTTRDGTAYMFIPWVKQVEESYMVEAVPMLDDQEQPVLDSKGKPRFKTVRKLRTSIVHNGVLPQAVELRDVVLCPAAARSVEDATTVYFKVYLNESQLRAMVAAGDLWEDAVERVLEYDRPGTSELAQDQQGYSTYTMGGEIHVDGEGSGAVVDKGGRDVRVRTGMSFWMCLTTQFDLENNPARKQKYIGWLHDPSHTLCGMIPFPYWHKRWPLVEFGLFRRANRAYHRGVPEMVRSLQEESNAIENQILNFGDLLLRPPRYHKRNVRIEDQENKWGLDADYEVDDKDDIGLLMQGAQMPTAPLEVRGELEARAKALVGVGTPGLGTPGGSQKVSSKQAAAWTLSQNVIIDMLCMNIRWSMKEVLEQTHELTLQYGSDPDDEEAGTIMAGGEKLHVPPEELALPFGLDVTGLTGGLDQEDQTMKVMTAYSLLRQDPLVSGDLGKWWYVVKMVLEQLGRPDIPEIIGDVKDAQAKQQKLEAAEEQKRQFEMQMQVVSHTSSNGHSAGAASPSASPAPSTAPVGGTPGAAAAPPTG